jgi:hypothetical protein
MKRKFFYLFVALLMITMPNVYAQETVPKEATQIPGAHQEEGYLAHTGENYNYVCPAELENPVHIIGSKSSETPLRIYINGEVIGNNPNSGALFVVLGGYVELIGVNNGTVKNSVANTIICSHTSDNDAKYSKVTDELDGKAPKDFIGDAYITIRNLTIDRNSDNNSKNTLYFGTHQKTSDSFYNATYVLENVTVKNFEGGNNNSATNGAVAINNANVTCTFNNCTFQDNNVSSNKTCGGVFVNAGTATFNNCTFTNNSGSTGGAVRIGETGHVTLNNCTISGSTAYSNNNKTGAVYLTNDRSQLILKGNTTITTQTRGGNIYLGRNKLSGVSPDEYTDAKFTTASDFTGTVGVTVENEPMAATPTRQITTNGSPNPKDGTITSDNNNLLVDYVSVSGATTPCYHQLLVPTIGEDMDNTEMIKYLNGHTNVSINLDRTIQTGGYNTICLPFAVSADKLKETFGNGDDDVILKRLASSTYENEVLTLHLEDATNDGIEAGKPYLIYVKATKSLNPGFDGVDWMSFSSDEPTLTTTKTEYCNFVPVFNPTQLQNDNKNILFLVGNNQLRWPDSSKYTAPMRGLRAYFVVKGDAMKARTFVLPFDDQTTAIVSLRQDSKELDTNAPMYDLLGQQVSSSYRGIVIQNGKKFVVK